MSVILYVNLNLCVEFSFYINLVPFFVHGESQLFLINWYRDDFVSFSVNFLKVGYSILLL